MKSTVKIPIVMWFDKSTVKHLRLQFSFFLLPVFLFALSQATQIDWTKTILAFLILHVLVFPSSNGYNSHQDRDDSSIGGLKNPPKVTYRLFYATLFMDLLALLLGMVISPYFTILIMVFILMSRAYSYRRIRLKKFPIIGFIVVFLFQGAYVYFISVAAITSFNKADIFSGNTIICMIISSLFIGSVYPLTQIYQHQADRKDGVISLSYKLGYAGTFIFSGLLYSLATFLMFSYFYLKHQYIATILFILIILPVVYKLSIWRTRVRKDNRNANYENTMAINRLASVSMNLYFLILIINRYGNWF
ncbi:MAG TPA: UbiA family prenyltransferase [Lentimicrobium sp.]|nr:UbiA family prenyltransferase [Lentimicrobium sp.]